MHPFTIGLGLALWSVAAATTAVGQPAGMVVCAGANHLTTTTSGAYPAPAQYTLGVRLQIASTIAADAVEWFFMPVPGVPVGAEGAGTVEVHATHPTTGLPIMVPSASATTLATVAAPNWNGPVFPLPVVLLPGAWWVTYTPAPTGGYQLLGVENAPPGPTVTPFAYQMLGVWSMQGVTQRFKVRLSALNCASAAIPGASVISAGQGCTGSAGPLMITPFSAQLPRLGNSGFALVLGNGTPSAPAAWFVAAFAQPDSIILGSGCSVHLEPVTFLSLFAAGQNPVLAGTTDAAGSMLVPVPIPFVPGLGGAILAVQAAVADSTLPTGFTTSNVLQLTIGI